MVIESGLRVLFVNDYYFSMTGSSTANQSLCRSLIDRGMEASVLTGQVSTTCDTKEKVYTIGREIIEF